MANKKIADLDPLVGYDADAEIAAQPDGGPDALRISIGTVAPRVESQSLKVDFSTPSSDFIRVSNTDIEQKVSVTNFLKNYLVSDLYTVGVYGSGGLGLYAQLSLQKIGQTVTGFVSWVSSKSSVADVPGRESDGSTVIIMPPELRPLETSGIDKGASTADPTGSANNINYLALSPATGSDYEVRFSYKTLGTYIVRASPISYIAQNTDIYTV